MSDSAATDWAIRTRNMTRRFGDLVAVDRLDLQVERGRIHGFLGPNGSGKSTSIRMLCGLLTPSEGDIRVLGLQIPQQAETLKTRIGYMTQKFALYGDLTVLQNLTFMSRVYDMPSRESRVRIAALSQQFELAALHKRLAGTLSGGQKQRLALAAALLHRPSLLFLDEPTSAVDPESRRVFWDALFDLAAEGTTLLVSTHYMDEAERCHALSILDRGRLVADGSPDALTAELRGRSFIIDAPSHGIRGIAAALKNDARILSVAQIGNRLRVLSRRHGLSSEDIQQQLTGASLDARVQSTEANLEDVFVAVTRTAVSRESAESAA